MKKTILIAMMGCAAFAWGCSNGTSGDDAGTDSGAGPDSGGQDSGGQDSGAPVNGCTTFTDLTADGGVVTGPSGASPSQYTPNCVHIKTGQSVTWNSNFSDHPLAPSGGDTPNPIQATASGTTVTFSFPSAGTFGFHCGIHPTVMFGAVEVTQ